MPFSWLVGLTKMNHSHLNSQCWWKEASIVQSLFLPICITSRSSLCSYQYFCKDRHERKLNKSVFFFASIAYYDRFLPCPPEGLSGLLCWGMELAHRLTFRIPTSSIKHSLYCNVKLNISNCSRTYGLYHLSSFLQHPPLRFQAFQRASAL